MPTEEFMTPSQVMLRPDPSRVVIRPFIPAEDPPAFAAGHAPRAQRIAVGIEPTLLAEPDFQSTTSTTSTALAHQCRSLIIDELMK